MATPFVMTVVQLKSATVGFPNHSQTPCGSKEKCLPADYARTHCLTRVYSHARVECIARAAWSCDFVHSHSVHSPVACIQSSLSDSSVLRCILHGHCQRFTKQSVHTTLLWSPYVTGQTIIILPCDFYLLSFFFFSSPNLSGRRLDVYHTSAHGVALVQI